MTSSQNPAHPASQDIPDTFDHSDSGWPETNDVATQPLAVALEAAKVEAADYKEKLLRTLAEMENLRRRTEREVKDAAQYAVTKFARDMLNVGDNLSRALQVVPEAVRDAAASELKTLLDGVALTERELLATLERHGVKKIDAQGQKFDPHVHQAMFEIEDPSVPHGTVLQVMQDGYAISDRVLRPAMVGVSKGGAKV